MINATAQMSAIRLLTVSILLFLLALGSPLLAAPPMPDNYTEDEEENEKPVDEAATVFGENLVDLIDELEAVLDEFDIFFEEFGQVSLSETADAIKEFRQTLHEEYSEEYHEEVMDRMEEVLDKLDEIKEETEEIDSRSQRKYLRRLRAFEDDLKDIGEELDDQFSGERYREILDAETLTRIINQAMRQAEKAIQETEKKRLSSKAPDVPSVPALPYSSPYDSKFNALDLDGSLTQSSVVTVDNDDIIIELNNHVGAVDVETWNRSSVESELIVNYSESSRKSRNLAEEIRMVTSHKDDLITIEVIYPKDKEKTANIIASKLEVSLPRLNPVEIENSFGPVSISDLQNRLTIKSNFASIDVQRIEGEVTIGNSTGPIYMEEVRGALQASNSFAPIEAACIDGEMKLANSYAPITVKKSSGLLQVSNSGVIMIHRHKGDVEIHSSNGEVEIYDIDGELNLTNSFGQVRIENITGDVVARNANAQMEISGVGGRLEAANSFAPTYIDGVKRDVQIASSNGPITIENAEGEVTVDNSFGEVSLETVGGPVQIDNSNASVSVSNAGGGVIVSNQFGPVYLSSISGNVVINNKNASVDLADISGASTVRTTFGLISGENLKGPFQINNQNGSVELVRLFLGRDDDCQVSTTFGDITIELPRPVIYSISAQTSGGEIESDLPMVMTASGNVSIGEYTGAKSAPTIILNGQNSSIDILIQK
jgi:hypothetical protein